MIVATPTAFRTFLRIEFVLNRTLDKGNPHPGAIGSDFNRLGIEFWPSVDSLDRRNIRRKQLLQELINWRNAIAHQHFDPVGDPTLHLARVRAWRRAVGALAMNFDQAMYNYLTALLKSAPWPR